MAQPIEVRVHHGDRSFAVAVNPEERADQLLLKSTDYFGIAPEDTEHYFLEREGASRGAHGLYLDRPIGDQIGQGTELVLERRDTDHHGLSTGSY